MVYHLDNGGTDELGGLLPLLVYKFKAGLGQQLAQGGYGGLRGNALHPHAAQLDRQRNHSGLSQNDRDGSYAAVAHHILNDKCRIHTLSLFWDRDGISRSHQVCPNDRGAAYHIPR